MLKPSPRPISHSSSVRLPTNRSNSTLKFPPQPERATSPRFSSVQMTAQRNISEQFNRGDDIKSEGLSDKGYSASGNRHMVVSDSAKPQVTNQLNTDNNITTCNTPVQENLPGCGSTQDKLESVESENPVLSRKKIIQEKKAIQLELHGLSPDVAPLNSPIPCNVRRAFKPPSRDGGTPVTTRRIQGRVAGTTYRTPLATKTNLCVGLSSGRRKSNVLSPTDSVGDRSVHEKLTLIDMDQQNSSAKILLEKTVVSKNIHHSQNDTRNSQILENSVEDTSTTGDSISTPVTLRGTGRRKRKATESSEDTVMEVPQKRRKSLRLNRS